MPACVGRRRGAAWRGARRRHPRRQPRGTPRLDPPRRPASETPRTPTQSSGSPRGGAAPVGRGRRCAVMSPAGCLGSRAHAFPSRETVLLRPPVQTTPLPRHGSPGALVCRGSRSAAFRPTGPGTGLSRRAWRCMWSRPAEVSARGSKIDFSGVGLGMGTTPVRGSKGRRPWGPRHPPGSPPSMRAQKNARGIGIAHSELATARSKS